MRIVLLMLLGVVMLMSSANAQSSLYRDVKAKRVGDIITVVLRENISGSSTSDSKEASSAEGSAEGTMSGNFLPFEPTFGTGATVNYGADQRNLSSQRQLLEGYISVQIKEVTATGDLIVEGSRETKINNEIHEMTLTGTVRQNDVDSRNQVLSYRIANANISYHQLGGVKEDRKKKGFLKKAIFAGIGVGLSAVIVVRELTINN